MPSTCDFQLNHPNGVYNSGDTVTGDIVLNTTSAKNVRAVQINFRGEGKVNWSETERRRKSDGTHTDETVYYSASELYVDHSVCVHGEETLPPGSHRYTFNMVLPVQCPASCEGLHGHIRYELSLKLNRPFGFYNDFSKPLTVFKQEDLNLSPIYRLPIEIENIFSTCWFSCSGGTINTSFKTPFSGYAVGQNINFSLLIQNQTMDDVEGYTVKFIRKFAFVADTPYHRTRYVNAILYSKKYDKSCLRLTTRIFDGSIPIESTPPSTENSYIIQVQYYIYVTLHMSGCTTDNEINLPIFIGTVPLRESILPIEPTESSRLIDIVPTAPDLPSDTPSSSDLPPTYQDFGPPTFEEATRGNTTFVDHDKR